MGACIFHDLVKHGDVVYEVSGSTVPLIHLNSALQSLLLFWILFWVGLLSLSYRWHFQDHADSSCHSLACVAVRLLSATLDLDSHAHSQIPTQEPILMMMMKIGQ